jgi:hypothetical protein
MQAPRNEAASGRVRDRGSPSQPRVPLDGIFPVWDRAVIITGANRKLFYETVSKMDWLPATLRRAIDRELGISPRERKKELTEWQTAGLRHLINQTKARMYRNGERPRGGIHDAAFHEVAKQVGRKSGALKQQFKRFKKYRLSKRGKVIITKAGEFKILP